jgi:hypothetical protein
MKRSTLILLILNGLVWGGMAWLGQDGLKGVEARVGHSNLGQVEFYLAIPLLMLTLSTVPAALLSRTKWSAYGNAWSIIALLLLLPYACVYGGGV